MFCDTFHSLITCGLHISAETYLLRLMSFPSSWASTSCLMTSAMVIIINSARLKSPEEGEHILVGMAGDYSLYLTTTPLFTYFQCRDDETVQLLITNLDTHTFDSEVGADTQIDWWCYCATKIQLLDPTDKTIQCGWNMIWDTGQWCHTAFFYRLRHVLNFKLYLYLALATSYSKQCEWTAHLHLSRHFTKHSLFFFGFPISSSRQPVWLEINVSVLEGLHRFSNGDNSAKISKQLHVTSEYGLCRTVIRTVVNWRWRYWNRTVSLSTIKYKNAQSQTTIQNKILCIIICLLVFCWFREMTRRRCAVCPCSAAVSPSDHFERCARARSSVHAHYTACHWGVVSEVQLPASATRRVPDIPAAWTL